MARALDIFAASIASLSSALVIPTGRPAHARSYFYLPTNTPLEAIAGDMMRVGTQLRLAQEQQKSLHQAEFAFPGR